MGFLLDTHTLIWTLSEPAKLTRAAAEAIQDPANDIFVSAVTFWEIAIKIRIKKLKPIGSSNRTLVDLARSNGLQPITLLPEEAESSFRLAENTHFDPFDRMLIWQAISRNLTLVSGDTEFQRFKRHGLKLLWK